MRSEFLNQIVQEMLLVANYVRSLSLNLDLKSLIDNVLLTTRNDALIKSNPFFHVESVFLLLEARFLCQIMDKDGRNRLLE